MTHEPCIMRKKNSNRCFYQMTPSLGKETYSLSCLQRKNLNLSSYKKFSQFKTFLTSLVIDILFTFMLNDF